MKYPIQTSALENTQSEHIRVLREIPTPPKKLFLRGQLPPNNITLLSVVGSRTYSSYGQSVITHLLSGLTGFNVGIVSGLALGIDGLAHEAALQNNLYTLAIPGSGLADTALYPVRHRRLANRILVAGGGLLSEYEPNQKAAPWTFPQRNRLVVGISKATLVIEAAEKSGSLISARLAVDYDRDLLVVPGNIFSTTSQGVHQFLKLGAIPVTCARDIIEILTLIPTTHTKQLIPETLTKLELQLLQHITEPITSDALIQKSQLPAQQAMSILMGLELKGIIIQINGNYQQTQQAQ